MSTSPHTREVRRKSGSIDRQQENVRRQYYSGNDRKKTSGKPYKVIPIHLV